jgi:hypothetical protein
VGRDYSRRKQFLPSIRCQTSFGFTRAVRPTKSTGPSVGDAPENEILASIDRPQRKSWGERRASCAVAAGGGDAMSHRRIGSTFWLSVTPARALDSEA